MKLVKGILAAALMALVTVSIAGAAPYRAERVTGGVLDLAWQNGFDTSNNMQPLTLDALHPAYNNPSGDHTVGVAENAVPDSGGIIVTSIDALGNNDYVWEAWMFTGDGNTRRGLIVRATPADNVKDFYMLVLESGLTQIRFRKIIAGVPTTLATYLTPTFPGGAPTTNSWHHMKIIAIGNQFRVFWDGHEMNGLTPITDSDLPTGNVGCYNFRFDIGQIPVYFDDLFLSNPDVTPARRTSLGTLKQLYR